MSEQPPEDGTPPLCTCGHNRRDHSGPQDHQAKIPDTPKRYQHWCHTCEAECIYCPVEPSQPPEDDAPERTKEQRLLELADKLCRSYTCGIGYAETLEHEPEQAEEHMDAAHALLPYIEEAPKEERHAAYLRGWDRGTEIQKKRTAEKVQRLKDETAELRTERDPDGLRQRIQDLEHALSGWDTFIMGRNRHRSGEVPDWKQTAIDYLAQLVEVQRELAELKGHQPFNAVKQKPGPG